jgi:hypothetical protein
MCCWWVGVRGGGGEKQGISWCKEGGGRAISCSLGRLGSSVGAASSKDSQVQLVGQRPGLRHGSLFSMSP